jgi:hypothetical protein
MNNEATTIRNQLPKKRLPKDRLLKAFRPDFFRCLFMARRQMHGIIMKCGSRHRPGHVDNPRDRVKFRRLSS